ncbi:hypothetical protein RISK_002531 [Rhodopirellula islandica]|uniref:Uncharacterized protein n=1 Tax=Rhodopirellula islandica TaxID=595434 RepID=A0A0J1EK71_RHOIS|nr:hypothetical protein RISK_002531 [Rhodopirellula islandica]
MGIITRRVSEGPHRIPFYSFSQAKQVGRSDQAQPCEPFGRSPRLCVKTVANASGSHTR